MLQRVKNIKIFAFSDWRVQNVDKLKTIILEENPDIILYAGDDLKRIVPIERKLFLKTKSHFIEFNKNTINSSIFCENKNIREQFIHFYNNFKKKTFSDYPDKTDFLLNRSFFYVVGNDDSVIFFDKKLFFRINQENIFINKLKSKIISETSKGKITLKDPSYYDFSKDYGIYLQFKLAPIDGLIKYNGLSIFGVNCSYGLDTQILNKPNVYADIYLSHVPPKGILDLSVRFGVDHIGSKDLFDSIKLYSPKLVICGHSHIWSGMIKDYNNIKIINVSQQDIDPAFGYYAIIDTNNYSIDIKEFKDFEVKRPRGLTSLLSNLTKIISDKPELSSDLVLIKSELLKGNIKILETEFVSKLLSKLNIKYDYILDRFNESGFKIIKNINLRLKDVCFLDVETGLSKGVIPGRLFLIGLYYKNELNQFKYPDEKDLFLNYLNKNKIQEVFCWTNYDSKAIRSNITTNLKFIDLCQRISKCVISNSYKLDDLYNSLFNRKNKSVLYRGEHLGLLTDHLIFSNRGCKQCMTKEELIEIITEKNKSDLIMIKEIYDYFFNLNVK